jgi:hypothetical protein
MHPSYTEQLSTRHYKLGLEITTRTSRRLWNTVLAEGYLATIAPTYMRLYESFSDARRGPYSLLFILARPQARTSITGEHDPS